MSEVNRHKQTTRGCP